MAAPRNRAGIVIIPWSIFDLEPFPEDGDKGTELGLV